MVYVPSERRIDFPFSVVVPGQPAASPPCRRHEYVYSWRSKVPSNFRLFKYQRKVNLDQRYGINLGPDLWTYSPLERAEDDKLFSVFQRSPVRYNSARIIPLDVLNRKQVAEGSLLDKLKWRNDLTRQVIDSAGLNSTSNNDSRRGKNDIGHDFSTVQTDWATGMQEMTDLNGTVISRYGIYPSFVRQVGGKPEYLVSLLGPDIPPWIPFPYDKGRWSTGVNATQTNWPSLFNTQFIENQAFNEMNPLGHGAQIGETIVELLRGNFPTILKNLKAAISKQQSIQKTLGSDYLNYQFGWKPLVNDFLNAFAVLASVDRMLFTESSRRSRSFSILEESKTLDSPTSISFRSHSTVDSPRTVYSLNGSLAGSIDTYHSSDARISAKFSPIARPSLGANYFSEGATDLVKQLGVWYPSLGWDLLPYSWLVDWSIGLGKAIENANAYNSTTGFVNIDYAYATVVTKSHVFFRYRLPNDSAIRLYRIVGSSSPAGARESSMFVRSISKNREPATPFGFGVKYGSLNNHQWSILVALGLAKSN